MGSLTCYAVFSDPSKFCSAVRALCSIAFASRSDSKKPNHRKLRPPKNLRHRRHIETSPDFYPSLRHVEDPVPCEGPSSDPDTVALQFDCNDGNIVWEDDEIVAFSSLFRGRVPKKSEKLNRERPLPLPLPRKIRPLGLPRPKKLIRTHLACSSRQPISNQIYKNLTFLISLAREIRSLPSEDNVSTVLNQWTHFLRKGSLSLTVRELGHMGLPHQALHVLCWVQYQPHLFPDDRILASTVDVLARACELKMPLELDKFTSLTSRSVYEAVVRGCIKGRNFNLALRLLSLATESKRTLDVSVYVKLLLELVIYPDKRILVLPLLDELSKREDLGLSPTDCTSIMKVCARLGKFDVVGSLYDWFRKSGGIPSVVMYTTVIHGLYLENRYRDAMAIVWEMEGSNCLLDLPAYRVLIKLFVAMNDQQRSGRYFSRLKESGFTPTYDIYRDVVGVYKASGRLSKCKEVWCEAKAAGFNMEMMN